MKNIDKIIWNYNLDSKYHSPTIPFEDLSPHFDIQIFRGAIEFKINGVDFGSRSLDLLDFSNTWMGALQHFLFHQDKTKAFFTDVDIKIEIISNKNRVEIAQIVGGHVTCKTICSIQSLGKALGDLNKSLILDLFKIYPKILERTDLLQSLNYGWIYAFDYKQKYKKTR